MKGKFGRILGNFATENGRSCADILCKEGHAVAYFGGAKKMYKNNTLKIEKNLLKRV